MIYLYYIVSNETSLVKLCCYSLTRPCFVEFTICDCCSKTKSPKTKVGFELAGRISIRALS